MVWESCRFCSGDRPSRAFRLSRSRPEQKALPAPVRMRTNASDFATSSSARRKSSISSKLIALRFSGRLSVMMATRASCSSVIVLKVVMLLSPDYLWRWTSQGACAKALNYSLHRFAIYRNARLVMSREDTFGVLPEASIDSIKLFIGCWNNPKPKIQLPIGENNVWLRTSEVVRFARVNVSFCRGAIRQHEICGDYVRPRGIRRDPGVLGLDRGLVLARYSFLVQAEFPEWMLSQVESR